MSPHFSILYMQNIFVHKVASTRGLSPLFLKVSDPMETDSRDDAELYDQHTQVNFKNCMKILRLL